MYAVKNQPPESTGPQPGNRRAPQGVLIRPRQQFKYAFILVAGGILAQSAVVAALAFFVNVSVTNVISQHSLDPEIGHVISSAVSMACTVMMLVAVGFAVIAVLVGVKLSHRIYGTMVPFSRHIEHLKNGNYSARIRLRKTDDLLELKDALNSLAEVLEAKHPVAKS